MEGSDQPRRHRVPQFRHSKHPTHGADAVMGTTRRHPKPRSYLIDGRVGEGTEVTPIRGQLELHRPRRDGSDELLVGAMSDPRRDGVPGRDQHHQTRAGRAGDPDPIIQRRDRVGKRAEPRITPVRGVHRSDLEQGVLQVRTERQRQQIPDLRTQFRIPPAGLCPVRPRLSTGHPTEVENWLIAGHVSSDHRRPTAPRESSSGRVGPEMRA